MSIHLVQASFVTTPFHNETFDFIFDMGCFHHVLVEDRQSFIQGVRQALKPETGQYFLVCLSEKNGPAPNHFTEEQLNNYFSNRFRSESLEHYGCVEADGYTRSFYAILMRRLKAPHL